MNRNQCSARSRRQPLQLTKFNDDYFASVLWGLSRARVRLWSIRYWRMKPGQTANRCYRKLNRWSEPSPSAFRPRYSM